ncbi:hypothetical protein HK101_004647 [Irineochytrium annulatum]|nr:hypothetical protein HK101_004647 [Irineochytrium annulatum]
MPKTKTALSLAELAEKAIVDYLAGAVKSINDSHHCSGTLDLGPIELFLKSRPTVEGGRRGTAEWFSFPPEPDAMEALVNACEPATFGLGSKDVYDPLYRKALKLDSGRFAMNKDPTAALMEKISKTLAWKDSSVVAEMYKLNIYGPGGHFKTHVDSPRASNMFGSLVVCLPSAHTGGQLVLSRTIPKKVDVYGYISGNPGAEIPAAVERTVFDWGGDDAAAQGILQWAAFYSDVEHEILPVETGHRVTLTYNLYWNDKPADEKVAPHEAVSVPRSYIRTPIHEALTGALAQPAFFRDGAILGFSLTRAYPITDYGWREDMRLKGGDNVIYEAAKALGLETELNPIYDVQLWDDDETPELNSARSYGSSFCEKKSGRQIYRHLLLCSNTKSFKAGGVNFEHFDLEKSEYEILAKHGDVTIRKDIVWCIYPTMYQEAIKSPVYGNEGCEAIYVSAALLIKVPSWSARHGV